MGRSLLRERLLSFIIVVSVHEVDVGMLANNECFLVAGSSGLAQPPESFGRLVSVYSKTDGGCRSDT